MPQRPMWAKFSFRARLRLERRRKAHLPLKLELFHRRLCHFTPSRLVDEIDYQEAREIYDRLSRDIAIEEARTDRLYNLALRDSLKIIA